MAWMQNKSFLKKLSWQKLKFSNIYFMKSHQLCIVSSVKIFDLKGNANANTYDIAALWDVGCSRVELWRTIIKQRLLLMSLPQRGGGDWPCQGTCCCEERHLISLPTQPDCHSIPLRWELYQTQIPKHELQHLPCQGNTWYG